MELSEKIRFFRVLYGLTQEDLGLYLDIGQNNIGMIERGRFLPRQSYIEDLAKLFGINENWLANGIGRLVKGHSLTIDIPPKSWGNLEKGPLIRKNNELLATLKEFLPKLFSSRDLTCYLDKSTKLGFFALSETEGEYFVLRCFIKNKNWVDIVEKIISRNIICYGLPNTLSISNDHLDYVAEVIKFKRISKIAQEIVNHDIRFKDLSSALNDLDYIDKDLI